MASTALGRSDLASNARGRLVALDLRIIGDTERQ